MILAIMAAAAALALTVPSYSDALTPEERIEKLREQIADIQDRQDVLRENIATIHERIAFLQGKIEQKESTIEWIQNNQLSGEMTTSSSTSVD